jgi:hypothetical protein
MGWNDRSERWNELQDEAYGLAEYYTEATGREITIGVDNSYEIYVEAPRISGREYFESLSDADDRLKQLYSEMLIEYSDQYGQVEDF